MPERRGAAARPLRRLHESGDGKTLSRIDDSRRTPEGWDMTVQRMVSLHDVRLTRTSAPRS